MGHPCNSLCDQSQDLHYIAVQVPEVAAGPEPESPASAWLEGYRQGRIEAEAAAGPLEAYVRGHWDGLNCEANGFGGRLDECEHVGRIYEPKAEAAAGPRTKHDPDTHEWEAVCLVPGCEAAAGPRDEAIELCPECGGQYSDLAGHRRFAHNVPEAAAGPVEYHDLSAAGDILGHGHSYADAAAGPRDVELPPEFVGFLVGEFMRAGFHKEPRAAQADARHIVESWNSRALAKASDV